MADYIDTQTTDQATIRIEVESGSKTKAGFGQPASSTGEKSSIEQNTYNQMLATIRSCANGVIDTLQTLESPPNAASIDFAIKVDAEAGAMVAKSLGDAQFKVSLSWKQVEAEPEAEEDE